MDKLQLTGRNMGWVFNFRSGCVYAAHLLCYKINLPNLKLKTWLKQLLGSLLLDIAHPDYRHCASPLVIGICHIKLDPVVKTTIRRKDELTKCCGASVFLIRPTRDFPNVERIINNKTVSLVIIDPLPCFKSLLKTFPLILQYEHIYFKLSSQCDTPSYLLKCI